MYGASYESSKVTVMLLLSITGDKYIKTPLPFIPNLL